MKPISEIRNLGPSAEVSFDLKNFYSAASFWVSPQLASAWIEHGPFAFWLVEALEPKCFVELGTHHGYSYFTVCEAVQRLGLDTSCYAIDTWKGDEHAGFYDEKVFHKICADNEKYSSFSRLVRSTFDQALAHFDDASIDLLHIDGEHFYDNVKHDFKTWLPKLSDRSVVIFHDTNVRENQFGVFRLWKELREQYPHFEFLHGHGLGILGVGKSFPDPIHSLFAAYQDPKMTASIREVYGRLGSSLKSHFSQKQQMQTIQELQAQLNQQNEENQNLRIQLNQQIDKIQHLQRFLARQAMSQEKGRGSKTIETAVREPRKVFIGPKISNPKYKGQQKV